MSAEQFYNGDQTGSADEGTTHVNNSSSGSLSSYLRNFIQGRSSENVPQDDKQEVSEGAQTPAAGEPVSQEADNAPATVTGSNVDEKVTESGLEPKSLAGGVALPVAEQENAGPIDEEKQIKPTPEEEQIKSAFVVKPSEPASEPDFEETKPCGCCPKKVDFAGVEETEPVAQDIHSDTKKAEPQADFPVQQEENATKEKPTESDEVAPTTQAAATPFEQPKLSAKTDDQEETTEPPKVDLVELTADQVAKEESKASIADQEVPEAVAPSGDATTTEHAAEETAEGGDDIKETSKEDPVAAESALEVYGEATNEFTCSYEGAISAIEKIYTKESGRSEKEISQELVDFYQAVIAKAQVLLDHENSGLGARSRELAKEERMRDLSSGRESPSVKAFIPFDVDQQKKDDDLQSENEEGDASSVTKPDEAETGEIAETPAPPANETLETPETRADETPETSETPADKIAETLGDASSTKEAIADTVSAIAEPIKTPFETEEDADQKDEKAEAKQDDDNNVAKVPAQPEASSTVV